MVRWLSNSEERWLRRARRTAAKIRTVQASFQAWSDEQLQTQVRSWRENASAPLLREPALALIAEVIRRELGLQVYDEQWIGAIALCEGAVMEMATGEGKTLSAFMAAFVLALPGLGVHVMTTNDYLAQRDTETLRPVLHRLGMSLVANLSTSSRDDKRRAHRADITYGTAQEFGFDYLRDHLVVHPADEVTRGRHALVLDEIDSILIDQARTPLMISGPTSIDLGLTRTLNSLASFFHGSYDEAGPHDDYWIERATRRVHWTEAGHAHLERRLHEAGVLAPEAHLFDGHHNTVLFHADAMLRAYTLFERDQHYIVDGNTIVVVDDMTGRQAPDRRWSGGLHSALEAKEGLTVRAEPTVLASITFQSYVRSYAHVCGMSGTAWREAHEWFNVYGLPTRRVPTHRPMIRQDRLDQVFLTAEAKERAVVTGVLRAHRRGQPVLLGVPSIEDCERYATLLREAGVRPHVLHARHHAQEAAIIAQAGQPGAVTVATPMAGRGTDIVLGGAPPHYLRSTPIDPAWQRWDEDHAAVVAAGGLHVMVTERHMSRRVDDQFRGRAGRQGDPGSSCFYLSLTDPLLKLIDGPGMAQTLRALGAHDEDAPLEHSRLARMIDGVQRRQENLQRDARQRLLDYDEVLNTQRERLYAEREQVLHLTTAYAYARTVTTHAAHDWVERRHDEWQHVASSNAWDLLLQQTLDEVLPKSEDDDAFWRRQMLDVLDRHWRAHWQALEHIRQGIGWRQMVRENPLFAYQNEAWRQFRQVWRHVRADIALRMQRRLAGEIDDALNADSTLYTSDDWDALLQNSQAWQTFCQEHGLISIDDQASAAQRDAPD